MKGFGGFIGLTENPTAFRHWMLSAPELARLKKQFEKQHFPDTDPDHPRNFQNHKQDYVAQKTFQKQNFNENISENGKSFLGLFSRISIT